ncbi:hypothetical protein FF1_039792 [Malus domestica]
MGNVCVAKAKPNIFSIVVGEEVAAHCLLKGKPNIFVFTVKFWPKFHFLDDITPDRAVFWVQAHSLPRNLCTFKTGRYLGGKIGVVLEVEDPSEGNLVVLELWNVEVPLRVISSSGTILTLRLAASGICFTGDSLVFMVIPPLLADLNRGTFFETWHPHQSSFGSVVVILMRFYAWMRRKGEGYQAYSSNSGVPRSCGRLQPQRLGV